MLAVDDAHWADRLSLQALIFALRRLAADQVLTVIAVRDDSVADLPESLGRLISGHRGTVLRLRGLDEEDLRDLAAAWASTASAPAQPAGCGTGRRETRCTRGRCWRSSRRPSGAPDDQLLPSPLSFRRLVQERYASSAAGDPAG